MLSIPEVTLPFGVPVGVFLVQTDLVRPQQSKRWGMLHVYPGVEWGVELSMQGSSSTHFEETGG